uniref:Uncharacterized protein n=1 Tax=Attheya septentrionalis TaxID=420275 RepID=A0A7S2UNR4_9STRA|mmetsp:Transcript_4185/g.7504  ORF Transcript_4185/g.7504 Transcript_4185/m.7504 type:complete len:486 (+) Transcript_4185:135-1592(+)
MSASFPIKAEPMDDDGNISMPIEGTSNISMEDYPTEDDEDEVVREIDLFISPELMSTLHLVQFPLMPVSLTEGQPSPLPESARFKQQHHLLELDYPLPSTQQRRPPFDTVTHRTVSSHSVPISTHMALGVLDASGTSMNLVPLCQPTLQMRPSFAHVDVLDDGGDDDEKDEGDGAPSKLDGMAKGKPLLFKKKESDRAALARKSSYAFKKASQDGEEWSDLYIRGPGTDERKQARRAVACPSRNRQLEFVGSNETNGSAQFVKSLNYLPDHIVLTEAASSNDIVDVDEANDEANESKTSVSETGDRLSEEYLLRDLVAQLSSLLLDRACPIPWNVLQAKFSGTSSKITDDVLLMALGSVAVLVRGNFVVQSRLIVGVRPEVALARDLVLILLNKDGYVQRSRLVPTLSNLVEEHTVTALLSQIGRKCTNGWELRLEDDTIFEHEFPDQVGLHQSYWEHHIQNEPKLSLLLQEYETATTENYSTKI